MDPLDKGLPTDWAEQFRTYDPAQDPTYKYAFTVNRTDLGHLVESLVDALEVAEIEFAKARMKTGPVLGDSQDRAKARNLTDRIDYLRRLLAQLDRIGRETNQNQPSYRRPLSPF
jgi:hypothetical protein